MALVEKTTFKRKKRWFFSPHSIKALHVAYGCPDSKLLSQHDSGSKIENHPSRVRENYTHTYVGGKKLRQTIANISIISQAENTEMLSDSTKMT